MPSSPRHTLFCDSYALSDAATLTIDGEEAAHAIKSRRLRAGDLVAVTDGRGILVTARIENARKTSIDLAVVERAQAPRIAPALHVRTATPKGQRLDKMVDQLSQVGAASWAPIETKLGVVDPGDRKLDRLSRIAIEAAKQCRRSWLLEIGASTPLHTAVRATQSIVIADTTGDPYRATGTGEITLLIGPEGGFTEDEIAAARTQGGPGAVVASFGPLAMRIETAAVVAAGIIIAAERARASG
jgi:16S rRNA (uracil1498-N3)-methyltransferase